MKPSISNRFAGGIGSLRERANRLVKKASGESALAMIFDESMLSSSIRIQLTNNFSVSKRIAVFPGALSTKEMIAAVAGLAVDAIAVEGTVITDGESTPTTVECVCPNLAFIQDEFSHAPQRISGLQLQTNSEAQFFEPIEVAEFNAVRNYGTEQIKPSDYLDPKNLNAKLVNINNLKHFQIDRNHVLVVTLAPGCSLDMSFTLGARLSLGQLLQDAAVALIGE